MRQLSGYAAHTHTGGFVASSVCQMLQVGARDFAEFAKQFPDVYSPCGLYARALYKAFLLQPSDVLMDTPPPDIEAFCLERIAWPQGGQRPSEAPEINI